MGATTGPYKEVLVGHAAQPPAHTPLGLTPFEAQVPDSAPEPHPLPGSAITSNQPVTAATYRDPPSDLHIPSLLAFDNATYYGGTWGSAAETSPVLTAGPYFLEDPHLQPLVFDNAGYSELCGSWGPASVPWLTPMGNDWREPTTAAYIPNASSGSRGPLDPVPFLEEHSYVMPQSLMLDDATQLFSTCPAVIHTSAAPSPFGPLPPANTFASHPQAQPAAEAYTAIRVMNERTMSKDPHHARDKSPPSRALRAVTNSPATRKRLRSTHPPDTEPSVPPASSSPEQQQQQAGPDKNPRDAPRRAFTCPFVWHNPAKHRDCLALKLHRIRDVKQHLRRRHMQPPACRAAAAAAGDSAEPDGVTPDDMKTMSRYPSSRNDPVAQWNMIWDTIFPERRAARPTSPFVDTRLLGETRALVAFSQTSGLRDGLLANPALEAHDVDIGLCILPFVIEAWVATLGIAVPPGL